MKTEWSSPSSLAEEVGIFAGTTVWEQKEKVCISEVSFTIKSNILRIHPLLKHPIQPAGATAHQVWGICSFSHHPRRCLLQFLHLSSSLCLFFARFLCFYQLSCLIFSLPHLVSFLSSWLPVFSWLPSSFAAVFVLTASCKVHYAARSFFPNLL